MATTEVLRCSTTSRAMDRSERSFSARSRASAADIFLPVAFFAFFLIVFLPTTSESRVFSEKNVMSPTSPAA